MQSATCFLLFAASLTIVSSQMTFSDGWGVKRSDARPFRLEGSQTEIDTPMLDECHASYSQSLIELHHKIMELYDNYSKCQNRALAVFKNKPQETK
ncbi:hypothetical protein M3Y97_00537000 [Aphelenchoides bicaudatus]|nr:hypothetical protein M3Y97_00537000 [Aphelenchoides bicaudatus]